MMIFLLPWLSLGHKNTVGVVVRIVIDYPYLSPHPTIGQCMELPEISPVPDWCHTSPSITNSELWEPGKKFPAFKDIGPPTHLMWKWVGDPDYIHRKPTLIIPAIVTSASCFMLSIVKRELLI